MQFTHDKQCNIETKEAGTASENLNKFEPCNPCLKGY